MSYTTDFVAFFVYTQSYLALGIPFWSCGLPMLFLAFSTKPPKCMHLTHQIFLVKTLCHLPSHLHISMRHTDTKDTACQGCSCWQACSLLGCLEQTHELAEYAGVISLCPVYPLCQCLSCSTNSSHGSLPFDPLVRGAQMLSPGLVNYIRKFEEVGRVTLQLYRSARRARVPALSPQRSRS